MNNTTLMKVALAFIGATMLVSCNDFYMDIPASELYTRAFIKEFGLIDPEQDWNMATEGTVSLRLGDAAADVTIYAKYGTKYYLVADLENMKGSFDVPFDVPKDCEDVKVVVNGKAFYGKIGETIDCSDHPARAAFDPSRASTYDGSTFTYDSINPWYNATINNITFSVEACPRYDGDGHLYFNAQQMAPILQKDVWADYYTMTDGSLRSNTAKAVGILPEISTPNRTYKEGNAYLHPEVTQDFVFQMKNPQDGFDIFPMFYGSNLRHTLGVYLIDNHGEAIRDASGNIIKYPIYTSKYGDDIQINREISVSEVILRGAIGSNPVETITDVSGYQIYMTTGSPAYTLQFDFSGIIPANYSFKIADQYGNFENLGNLHFSYQVGAETRQITSNAAINNINRLFVYTDNAGDSDWFHLYVYEDGSLAKDFACHVHASAPASTEVKRVEIWDGATKIENPAGLGIGVTEGQTKTYTVKCYDALEGGNIIASPAHLKIGNWHNSIFIASLDGDQLSITGVSSSAGDPSYPGVQWTCAWIDLDGDDSPEDDDEPKVSLKVTVSAAVLHTFTTKIIEWPAGLTSHSWSEYFVSASRYSKPRRAAAEPLAIYTGPSAVLQWGTEAANWADAVSVTIESANFASVDDYDKIRIAYHVDPNIVDYSQIQLCIDIPGNWTKILEAKSVSSSPEEYTLTSDDKTNLKLYPLVIQGCGIVIENVYLVKNADAEGPGIGEWKEEPYGKTAAANALQAYYEENALSGTCNHDGHSDGLTLTSTDAGVTVAVEIPGDATLSSVKFIVTLSKTVAAASAPRRGGPKGPIYKGASASSKKTSSRADAAYTTLISEGGALYHDGETTWYPIRKAYSHDAQTCDSYPYTKPLLVKSRGYRVKLKNSDNTPYEGYFGMYIDYDWGDFESPDGSVNTSWIPGQWGRPKSGTHYSQSQYNTLVYGGKTYNISYASTFTHPMSSNEYLCFEDWDVTKPVGDIDTDGNAGTATFRAWNWNNSDHTNSDYSSDRDLNDIIYRQVGLIPTRSSEITTEAKGFTWIWALEDLGSTDDFDFNDVVMRIQTLTTSKPNPEDAEHPIIVKRIILTPRCAGGTLPIYVHFNYNKQDYILEPGEYDLTSGTDQLNTGAEYHTWFGAHSYTTMINTGAANGSTVSDANIKTCTLIVSSDYKLNYVPTPGITDAEANTSDAYTLDGVNSPLYVTVNGSESREQIDEDRLKGTYRVALPEKGAAPQSFIIVEQKYTAESTEDAEGNITSTGESTDYAKPWYWPKERAHILDAYPHFSDWIKNHNKSDWYINYSETYVYISQ